MGWREESRSPVRKVRICPAPRLPASRNRLAHASSTGHHRATAYEAGLVVSLLERPKGDLSCSTPGKVKHLAMTLHSRSRAHAASRGEREGWQLYTAALLQDSGELRTGSMTGTGIGLSWGTWWVIHTHRYAEKSRRSGFICRVGCFLIGQQVKGEEPGQVKGIVI